MRLECLHGLSPEATIEEHAMPLSRWRLGIMLTDERRLAKFW